MVRIWTLFCIENLWCLLAFGFSFSYSLLFLLLHLSSYSDDCLRGFQETLFTPSRLSNACVAVMLISQSSISPDSSSDLSTSSRSEELWATPAIFFSQETFLQSTISRSIAGSDSTTSASLDLSVKLLICAREETNEYDRNCSFYDVWWFYFKKSYCAYSV